MFTSVKDMDMLGARLAKFDMASKSLPEDLELPSICLNVHGNQSLIFSYHSPLKKKKSLVNYVYIFLHFIKRLVGSNG